MKNSFLNFKLSKELIENINSLGFTNPTTVQKKSLEVILDKKDVIVQAKTGSGKTVAFSIPIALKVKSKDYFISSLILVPTRELADQVALQIRKLIRYKANIKVLTLCGGVPFKPQVASLKHSSHIVVATPGRLLKHINDENIKLDRVDYLVLDEADKMLEMGFYDDVIKIIETLPKDRQTLLFSATFEEDIKKLGSNILKNEVFIKVEEERNKILQKFYEVNQEEKTALIPSLISSNKASSVLIFCNMKIKCEQVADDLYDLGLDVLTLHSDMEQKQRDETLVLFSNKSYPILIATDVASRGLHIDDVELVINYDLAKDEKVHTHRIGRTARAGKGGVAISLFTSNDEDKLEDIKSLEDEIIFDDVKTLQDDLSFEIDSDFRTIYIDAGKKQKVRAGDIIGAFTAAIGLNKEDIGKIDILNFCSYVAVKKEVLQKTLEGLKTNKIKGKFYNFYEK